MKRRHITERQVPAAQAWGFSATFPARARGWLGAGTFLLALCVVPASAWQVTVAAVCVLTHQTPQADLRMTYDPGLPKYTITLTRRDRPWARGPVFSMQFLGPAGRVISTDRQVLDDGGAALSVTDRGFGNVLDGMQFNRTAIAVIGGDALSIPLEGAAPAVAAFRACTEAPLA